MDFSKTVILETQFFPSFEYMAQVVHNQYVVIEACENYQKGSYRNRCHIATAQGLVPLSIPLKKGKNSGQNIRDVQIAYDVDWQRQHWQTLRTAYGSAPFWPYYAPVFEPFFQKRFDYLFDYNAEILATLLKILKVQNRVNVAFSDNYLKEYTPQYRDLRNVFSPKTPLENTPKYPQIFEDRLGFVPNLSVLDLIFCAGNRAVDYLSLQTAHP